jgi:hypothetical protein
MKTRLTKLLTLILVLALALTMLPMSVFADEPADQAEETAKTVAIADTILTDGCFRADYSDETAENVTYQWSKSETETGDYTPCEDRNTNNQPVVSGNSINVALDGGGRMWYKVTVKDADGAVLAESAPKQVEYASSIQNGSFETPDGNGKSFDFYEVGTAGLEWKTSNQDTIEIADWSHNPYGYHAKAISCPEGEQIAEINANKVGSLYQDILTYPGETLTWSVDHAARMDTGDTTEDDMYVLISPANVPIEKPNEQPTSSDISVTLIKDPKKNADGSVHGWTTYYGSYEATQYVTRLYFSSFAKDDHASYGNLIDNVTLQPGTLTYGYPYTINYYLIDGTNRTLLKQSVSTQYVNDHTQVYAADDQSYSRMYIAASDNPTAMIVTANGTNVWDFCYYAPHSVRYSWSSAPEGQALPTDSGKYKSGDAYAVDGTYTSGSKVDTKDQYGNVNGTWTFSGWTDPNGGTMGASDVTVTGTWTYEAKSIGTSTVTYSWTSGTTGKELPGNIGTIPDAVTDLVKNQTYTIDKTYTNQSTVDAKDADNHVLGTWTFSGWTDPNNGTMGASDVTVTGAWTFKAASYTITYQVDGAVYGTKTYEAGAKVDKAQTPVKSGYVFSGWDKATPKLMPAHDITITGTFTQEHYNIYPNEIPTGTAEPIPTGLNAIDHIAYLIGRKGYAKPNAPITRAEVASIFFRLLTDETRETYLTSESGFSDVKSGDWYNTMVDTLAEMGIVKGYSDGTFRPDAPITRAEFAAIAARFDTSDVTGKSASFTDIADSWAKSSIERTAILGWTKGYADGSFKPNENITRAEVAALVNRVLQRHPGKSGDLLDDMVRWPDNADTSAWYYLDIQEASNSHDYDKYGDGLEKWTALNANPDWTQYQK